MGNPEQNVSVCVCISAQPRKVWTCQFFWCSFNTIVGRNCNATTQNWGDDENWSKNGSDPKLTKKICMLSVCLLYTYLCMYLCMYVCMYVRTYVRMYACMHACIYVCILYIYSYIALKFCLPTYTYTYTDTYRYIYTYIYIHIHI